MTEAKKRQLEIGECIVNEKMETEQYLYAEEAYIKHLICNQSQEPQDEKKIPPEVDDETGKKIEEYLKEVRNKRNSILEEFTKAYLAETGLKPSEVEMITELGKNGTMVTSFRAKEN